MGETIDHVTGIAIFPLKGAQAATVNGEPPTSLPVDRTGFEVKGVRDRDLVLFDPNERAFVSQRGYGGDAGRKTKYPQDRNLAGVQVDIHDDYIAFTSKAGTLQLPTAITEGEPRPVDIWGKRFTGIDQGQDAARYFSDPKLLGRPVQLLRSDRSHPRMLPERYQRQGAFNEVAGADGQPFLLVNEASLAYMHGFNSRTKRVPLANYRGNIVVSGEGLGVFGEDFIDPYTKFSIGAIGCWATKACSRCIVTNNDQETGVPIHGGLAVMRGRAGALFTGGSGLFFGQNVVHSDQGVISVGDELVIPQLHTKPNVDFTHPVFTQRIIAEPK